MTGLAVDVLRGATQRAVDGMTLRAVAEQIGLTHRGLGKFLAGTDPRAATVGKLRDWYVRGSVGTGAVSAQTAAAALAVLVDGLPPGVRDRVAADLVDVLRYAYSNASVPPPDWLRRLRE